jgi:hypothetical protein
MNDPLEDTVHDTSTFRRFLEFIRRNGLADMPARVKQEICTPTTPLGRRLHPVWRMGRYTWRELGHHVTVFDDRTLLVFYDLQVSPITFDFAWFLVAADLERRRRRLDSLHVIIVSGRSWESGPESQEYLSVVDGPARRQRVFDVLLPLTELMPSIGGVTFVDDRPVAGHLFDTAAGRTFPHGYSPELPFLEAPFPKLVTRAAMAGESVPSLRAPQSARHRIDQWRRRKFGDRPIATITIRDFDYQPARNSDLAAWSAFAHDLQQVEGMAVVLIPDTHRTLENLPEAFAGLSVFIEPAWNIALRSALYEAGFVNLGVNTGPMALNWLNRSCRYITYKMVVDEEPGATLDFQLSLGLDPRQPFPFAAPCQRLCVGPDNLFTLRQEFAHMRDLIHAGHDKVPSDEDHVFP